MGARVSHAHVMRGLAAIVHHALDRCRADGVPIDDASVSALALVDDWLARGAPDVDERAAFAQARDASFAAGEAASKTARAIGGSAEWQARDAERKALIRANWLATAVGNLCHKALKERGWNELATVVDAVACAAPGVDAATWEELRATATAAAT